ncbi:Carboxylic ester hydrolase [Gryllus bimaculatus]|nr:Carboxylic ester hydrolase [Gryllus bimaculatus]
MVDRETLSSKPLVANDRGGCKAKMGQGFMFDEAPPECKPIFELKTLLLPIDNLILYYKIEQHTYTIQSALPLKKRPKDAVEKYMRPQQGMLFKDGFAPELWSTTKRPVIVIIHGGAFVQWNGNMEFTRPDPLLKEGVLVVSINYRLGVMGFLNTEDSQAPGNAGLKDQTMALRWVQRNIAAFGGDPNKVTIMGESAGGASVHYHLLSPLSRGLFHGAISVSGSALPAWARVQRPREQALALRRRFAGVCSQLPEEDIVSCLRQVDAQELVFNQDDLPREPRSRGAYAEGNFARVPYMTGFTSAEGIQWLDCFWRLQLCTDTFIAAGSMLTARAMAQHNATVYMYKFTRDGPLGIGKQLLNATEYPGVMHGDDMLYVYDYTEDAAVDADPWPVPASEQPIRERQAKIFANMIKTGYG